MLRNLSRADLAILGLACAAAFAHAVHFDHTTDDAYISFRYVDNLVAGHGLVFNVGERVMGFSNLLWVLLLALLELVGIAAPVGARLLGALFAWGTLVCLYDAVRASTSDRLAAGSAVAFVAAFGTFALWIFGGLEGHLFAFLLVLGVTRAMRLDATSSTRRFAWLGVVFGLAALTRPEGAAYAAPVAVWLALRERNRRRWAQIAVFLAVVAAFAIGQLVWAAVYYGDPLPNTYYAKHHPLSAELLARGARLCWSFVRAYYGAPVLAIALWLAATRARRSSAGWLPLLVVGCFLGFFLRVGGDALVYNRMFLWILPMLGLLLGEALASIRIGRPAVAAIAAGLVALALPNSFVGANIDYLRRDEQFLREAALIGQALHALPPDTVVAANNVGVLGYTSRLRIVDMLGITDPHIARSPHKSLVVPGHGSHDAAYVLAQRPQLVFVHQPLAVLQPAPPSRTYWGAYVSDLELMELPEFARDYGFTHIPLPDGRFAPVFMRKPPAALAPSPTGDAHSDSR